jgi:DNA-binding NarL/FixJ family response regulator
MKPHRTVLIDDHQLFNDGLRLILNNTPDFVVVAQVFDSRLACEVCQQHQPDLVLIDYNMPHLNGLAVMEQLRQLPAPCRLVIVSMYAEKAEIARFETLGIDGFFAKTVPANRLVDLLERVMQGERVIETDVPDEQPPSQTDYFRLRNKLTKREVDILKGVKQELTTRQIAARLGLSYHTVQTHRKHINAKLPFKTDKAFKAFLDQLDD